MKGLQRKVDYFCFPQKPKAFAKVGLSAGEPAPQPQKEAFVTEIDGAVVESCDAGALAAGEVQDCWL